MSTLRKFLVAGLGLLFLGTAVLIFSQGSRESAPKRTPADQILVTPEWLQENKDSVTILDSARSFDAFLEGHIPGAAWVVREVSWDTVGGISGMLPDHEVVAAELADAGVSNDTPVVIYDGGNGLWASRLFWALEYLGHSKVHILDGGYAAWTAAGLDVSTDPQVPARGDFTAALQPELIADKAYVLDNLGSLETAIFDTRSEAEYTGVNVQAERGGHIPGSLNIEWTKNVGEGRSFRDLPELDLLYADALKSGQTAITLCQTGVRGAHTYVALRLLGHENVRVYDGSWAEWGNDPTVPVDL
ncbi:sulfurtransferase [Spirochaeta dissipatitropha]